MARALEKIFAKAMDEADVVVVSQLQRVVLLELEE
jgi:hypothetical protein